MNNEKLSKEQPAPALNKGAVSSSVFICSFCGGSGPCSPIDKGFYHPNEPIKNFWTKEYRIYACYNCKARLNPHRYKTGEYNGLKIGYLDKLTKGDKAKMARSLHRPLTP